ncbi:hypothetical protein V9T40_013008 [Parthenolecanium corni]|uniref:Amino acid transporter transmembrane domain-containing protein n=1 Tax=Parthenolecanium corni TaxID=536013 RepID=A0AAN9XZV9_9HEMI
MKPDSSSHDIDIIKDFPYFEDFEGALAVKKSKSEYDPHEHVNSVFEIGFVGASVHLICAAVGTTILLTPFAFRLVGYGVAITAMAFASVLYVNNLHSLLWTEYQLCKMLKVQKLTFVSVVQRSFEVAPENLQLFGSFLKSLMYVYWVLPFANGIYLIVISDGCRAILNDQRLQFDVTITVVLLVMMALCLLPRLWFLVPLSVLANIFILLNLAIISITSIDVNQWTEAKFVGDLDKLPQFLSIFSSTIGMTAMVIPLKNEMSNPKEFTARFGVLNTSFGVLSLIIGSFGLLGYLNYGANVEKNILLNLPAESWLTSIVLISYSSSLCITYILIFYTYEDTMWNGFLITRLKGSRYETTCKYCLRVSINIAAYGMAVTIHDLNLLVSIVGTMAILIEVCLPSVLHLLVSRVVPTKPSARRFLVIKNSVVIILSTIIFGMSMNTCVSGVIKLYKKK